MAEYSDLDHSFEQQLERTAGFVPAAFHVHSIESFDWGKEADPRLNDPEQFKGSDGQRLFLDKLAASGLELVCITDHMKASYACELAELARGRDDIAVLPGVEISCSVPPGHREYIHVLAVFPPGTTPDVIERLFSEQPELPGAAQRTGRESASFPSLADVRQRVDKAGGIFILAHIDQDPRGHRCYVRSVRGESAQMFAIDPEGSESVTAISTEYAEHLVELAPHAVEVMKSTDRAHYWDFETADGNRHGFPCVARSDHHSVEALSDPQSVTHVKVSRREIDCVRDALVFHETRLRFADDLPDAPSPRLVGLRLRGGGLFEEATIALNENLNCIIGPRGCGKSTVIEAFRYVLGQRPLLGDPNGPPAGDRSYASLALATQAANLRDSEIELIYELEQERHVLAATYDPTRPVATRVFSLDGDDCRVPHEAIETAYPARIFSWSELETLGRQPHLQRLVVDRLAAGLPELQDRARRLRSDVSANRARAADLCRDLTGLLDEERGALLRYSEYKTAYEQLNTPEVQELFRGLDRARERIEALEALEKHLIGLAEEASTLAGRDPAAAADALMAERSPDVQEWWTNEAAPRLDLAGLRDLSAQRAGVIASEAEARRQALATQLDIERSAADRHEAALREQTHASPGDSIRRDQREQARQRLETATALRHRYKAAFTDLEAVLTERGQLLAELAEATGAISKARDEVAKDLGSRLAEIEHSGPAIAISVRPGADRDIYAGYLEREFLDPQRGGHYKAKELPQRLAQIAPSLLCHAILSGSGDVLAASGDGLTRDEADRLVGAFAIFRYDEHGQITRVAPELDELLELQEQPVDDLVRIESDGQPVDRLSPGGRSSAMLPLIALSDNVPLIIDQPEDNLDNRMVGQTLSSILSRLKERRQIIVTTHNPNIVVGGDAEQVVVLDAPAARSAMVERTGNIDDPEIIDAVIKIMEGGRAAFEERSRRYRGHFGH